MKKIKFIAPLIFWLLMIFSSLAFGYDYFLYDIEKNKILYMGENDTAFTEKIDFTKNPHLIMATDDPDKFLAVYAPDDNSNSKEKKPKESKAGQLIIFNIATGRTEDLVDLGFLPFRWVYTKDRQHFFITYKPTPDSKTMEMLHYEIKTQKAERLSDFASEISELDLSDDETKLYAVADRTVTIKKTKKFSDVLTITYSPLAVQNSLSSDKKVLALYVLSRERIALINLDLEHEAKSVTLINTLDNSVIQEQKLKLIYTVSSWYEQEHLLIVAGFETREGAFGLTGNGQFCRVSANEIQLVEPSRPWIDYEYLPEKDCLYILSENHLEVIDYKNSTKTESATGSNIYHEYFYQIYHLPDSNLAAIYCFQNSEVKFYDLAENKILARVNCGRSGVKFLLSFFNVESKTVVTTSQDKLQYFVLNRATKDITVLDQNFNKSSFIVPPDPPLGMFQIKKPVLRTLITTSKGIYRLNEETSAFEAIYDFKEETKETSFYEDNKRIILITDKELLVINSETLKIENNFFLFGDPNAKYTKLQPGMKRYYFIRAL